MPEAAGRLGTALDHVPGRPRHRRACSSRPSASRSGPPPGPASARHRPPAPSRRAEPPIECLGDRPGTRGKHWRDQPRRHGEIGSPVSMCDRSTPCVNPFGESDPSTSSPVTTPIGRLARPGRSRIRPHRGAHDRGFSPPALVTILQRRLLDEDRSEPLEQLGKVGHDSRPCGSLQPQWLRIAIVSSARYSSVSTSIRPSRASRKGASRLSPQKPAPLPTRIVHVS